MSGYLIKDTTKEERIRMIKEWQEPDDISCGGGEDLFDTYADYINGIREISEINQSLTINYMKAEPDPVEPLKAEGKPSTADEIIKLKNLLDQGVLTQEEFQAAKEKVLGL